MPCFKCNTGLWTAIGIIDEFEANNVQWHARKYCPKCYAVDIEAVENSRESVMQAIEKQYKEKYISKDNQK